ncbi:hypothetical protein Tdes44962_MAKER03603 [Teratosphaeria destructans]|uniref:F-box domain-containing protein n=1 Tax=Teratosphaeria destructans TaxID=418781 RepID=A0A9W7SP85_9PEZI|nr:hypothetical protein Tdes44962_MAKER03603 [Teratosphaeria destructans]
MRANTWRVRVRKAQKRMLAAREILTNIKTHIPESTCEHCSPDEEGVAAVTGEASDSGGYSLLQGILVTCGRAAVRRDPVLEWQDGFHGAGGSTQAFRFLDLPPELRNRIYEFAFTAPIIRRECSPDTVCLPCQLHRAARVANSGLARVSAQLHAETALVPYAVNTFSVHNLYYLQTFLELIGERGRKHLRSLAFQWRVPQDEAYSLRMVTSHWRAYRLLLDCTALTTLDVHVDAFNLLSRKCDGLFKDYLLDSLDHVPSIELLEELRGLQDIKFGWGREGAPKGMVEWAESWIKLWRLPRGSWEPSEIEESEKVVSVNEAVGYVHWRARGFGRNDASPAVHR